jgi:hypothetical protein
LHESKPECEREDILMLLGSKGSPSVYNGPDRAFDCLIRILLLLLLLPLPLPLLPPPLPPLLLLLLLLLAMAPSLALHDMLFTLLFELLRLVFSSASSSGSRSSVIHRLWLEDSPPSGLGRCPLQNKNALHVLGLLLLNSLTSS